MSKFKVSIESWSNGEKGNGFVNKEQPAYMSKMAMAEGPNFL